MLQIVTPGARAGRETMFAVYRTAYGARLTGILKSEYPRLSAFMGDDAFEALAARYFACHPSPHRSARWVGANLPAFLRQDERGRTHPVLADLAALEEALSRAFDAADAPQLSLQALSAISPDRWSGLSFTPHPSVCRLDFGGNALAIWTALKDEAEPPRPARTPQPERLFVWRQDALPRVRRLSDEEAMLWDEAARGTPFGRLCELAAVFDDPATAAGRAATALAGWLAQGAITAATVPCVPAGAATADA